MHVFAIFIHVVFHFLLMVAIVLVRLSKAFVCSPRATVINVVEFFQDWLLSPTPTPLLASAFGGDPITKTSLISVIVPVYNEGDHLRHTLDALTKASDSNVEILLVDGGSTDESKQIAQEYGLSVSSAPSGRAKCQNFGASQAKGAIFLFLHADTCIPPNFCSLIRNALSDDRNLLGAFRFRIDDRTWFAPILEWGTNLRAKNGQFPYGDQALFLRRGVFEKVGGFPNQKLMEDYEFVRQIRAKGHVCVVDENIVISSRRWKRLGYWNCLATNQLIILAYRLGITADRLASWYYPSKVK